MELSGEVAVKMPAAHSPALPTKKLGLAWRRLYYTQWTDSEHINFLRVSGTGGGAGGNINSIIIIIRKQEFIGFVRNKKEKKN